MFQETDKWFYAQVVKPDFGVLVFGVLRGQPGVVVRPRIEEVVVGVDQGL